jgi:uncharacterized protein YsxB (DUF464 family)
MIKITIYVNEDNIVGFESKGHANFAKHGYDIVCAAVSVLTQTAVNSLEKIAKVIPVVKIDEKKGYLKCITNNYKNIEVQIIFKVMIQGLNDVKESYGNFVELLYKEV